MSRVVLWLALLGIAMAAEVEPASAVPDEVRGTVTFALKPPLARQMKAAGVRIVDTAEVDVKGRRATIGFGAARSSLDPVSGEGTIADGAARVMKFRRGRREVYLHELEVDTARRTPELRGRVGGRRTLVAEIGRLSHFREGFGAGLFAGNLKLTGTAARILNSRLGVRRLFTRRLPFASLRVRAQPADLTLVGGEVRLAIYQGLIDKLKSLQVEAFRIQPASLSPSTLTVPVEEGGLLMNGRRGFLLTAGGLQLIQFGAEDKPTLNISEFSVALDTESRGTSTLATPTHGMEALFEGPSARQRGSFAAVDTRYHLLRADPSTRTVQVTNVVATLDQRAAETFNELFAEPRGRSPVFVPGEPLGHLTATLHAQ